MDMNAKSCIVTGAADGVGLAVAQRLAENGARVVMADTDEETLTREATRLGESGLDIVSFAGDIHERLTMANLISTTIDAFERVDVLVNASRNIDQGDPMSLEPGALADAFDLNVTAPFRLIQLVVKRFQKQASESEEGQPAGSIVNVTSIAATRSLPEMTAYAIACAGLEQMTRSLAVRLAAEHIRVNAVAIGSIMSSNLRSLIQNDPELRARILAVTPAGRLGESEDAAEAVAFLASDAARFVTGQVLNVDGGRSLADPLGIPTL